MWLGAQLLAVLVLSALTGPAWSANTDQDIVVRVLKDGQNITVDVDCPVDAPWSLVWEVLTDYDHMAEFVSNLEFSGVKYAEGNLLRVHQKGKASRGPLTLTFDNVREIELVPSSEIRSRLISGDMKASDFVTRIVEVAARVHIVNSGHYTPNMWVPPIIGPAVDRGRNAEAVRRNKKRNPAPQGAGPPADVTAGEQPAARDGSCARQIGSRQGSRVDPIRVDRGGNARRVAVPDLWRQR